MKFAEFFTLNERTDPDVLYQSADPKIINFIVVPGMGYIYGLSQDINGSYLPLSHIDIKYYPIGKLISKDKIKVQVNDNQFRYLYFYLTPGTHYDTMRKYMRANPKDIIEGRVQGNVMAVWQPRLIFAEMNTGKLAEKMLTKLGIDPQSVSYNFAEVGDIDYAAVYDKSHDEMSPDKKRRAAEMHKLRQIHLNPELKRQIIPSNDKAKRQAQAGGFDNIAQMKNRRIIGDSFGS